MRKLPGRHQVLINLLVHLPVPEGTFQLSNMDETCRSAERKSQVLHVICPHSQAALTASPQNLFFYYFIFSFFAKICIFFLPFVELKLFWRDEFQIISPIILGKKNQTNKHKKNNFKILQLFCLAAPKRKFRVFTLFFPLIEKKGGEIHF